MEVIDKSLGSGFEDYVKPGEVFMFSKSYCPYCDEAKHILENLEIKFKCIECDEVKVPDAVISEMQKRSGIKTYPNIWVDGKSIGGCDKLKAAKANGSLFKMLDEAKISYKKS